MCIMLCHPLITHVVVYVSHAPPIGIMPRFSELLYSGRATILRIQIQCFPQYEFECPADVTPYFWKLTNLGDKSSPPGSQWWCGAFWWVASAIRWAFPNSVPDCKTSAKFNASVQKICKESYQPAKNTAAPLRLISPLATSSDVPGCMLGANLVEDYDSGEDVTMDVVMAAAGIKGVGMKNMLEGYLHSFDVHAKGVKLGKDIPENSRGDVRSQQVGADGGYGDKSGVPAAIRNGAVRVIGLQAQGLGLGGFEEAQRVAIKKLADLSAEEFGRYSPEGIDAEIKCGRSAGRCDLMRWFGVGFVGAAREKVIFDFKDFHQVLIARKFF